MIHPAAERKRGRFGGLCHSKSGTISHLHRKVERLQDNESFCIGDEAMQLDMVKRPDEEEEDLDSAQVAE